MSRYDHILYVLGAHDKMQVLLEIWEFFMHVMISIVAVKSWALTNYNLMSIMPVYSN